MKRDYLYESFADEFKAAKALRKSSPSAMSNQRRQRTISDFIASNNGEWFSFYDMLEEKNQWYTVFADIMYAFNFIYNADEPLNTRIFVENCTNSDISQLKREITSFIKRKQYECNVYNVFMEDAADNVTEIKNEMRNNDAPAIVMVDSINVTKDMVYTYQATDEEIGDAIDRLTEEIMPTCGVLIYFERWPQHEDEYAEDEDELEEAPERPEGFGTMRIPFED